MLAILIQSDRMVYRLKQTANGVNKMSRMILANAFSLNMLDVPMSSTARVEFTRISTKHAGNLVRDYYTVCAIGHTDTMAVVNNDLCTEFQANRMTVSLEQGDTLVVAQYKGPRLEEGTKELPEGATIEYYLVEL